MMKRLIVILIVAVALYGSPKVVHALGPLGPDVPPYVSISVTPNILYLGTVPFWSDLYESPGSLMMEVKSNCMHGHITASITDLVHKNGCRITSDRIYVSTPATDGFVSMAKPVVISDPTEGSHNIKMDFQVCNKFQIFHAGRYSGALTFMVMPPAQP